MMKAFPLLGAALVMTLVSSAVRADEMTLEAVENNTLYETEDGSLSNGAGQSIFVGNTSGVGPFSPGASIRRALLAFDIAANIPAGSTINSATLTLELAMTTSGAQTVSLHRVLSDWGEGTSDATVGVQPPPAGGGGGAPSTPGDATWIHTFYPDAFWEVPGGDFLAGPSASQEVDGLGSYTWSSAIPAAAGVSDMVADVQGWLDDPTTNAGWILTGNEADARTTKRFNSRHNAVAPPLLTIDFTPVVSDCVGDCNNSGEVTVDNVMTGINIALGLLPVSACPAFAVDGVVNILSLIQGVDNLLDGCPNGAFIDFVCQTEFTDGPDSPSRIELYTAALPTLAFPFDAAIRTVCNEDLGDGRYLCESMALSAAATTIPGLFTICTVPGTQECPFSVIDCDGGSALGINTVSDSSVGECMGSDDCSDQCVQYCADLGVVVGGGCTGYCQGGENDGNACATAEECPEGACRGADGPLTPDICQCSCFNPAAGSPGGPGESQGFVAISTTIEMAPPCDGMDVIADLGEVCAPNTTATFTDVILNANFEPGGTVPVDGPFVSTGVPLGCETLHAGTATGLETVTVLNVQGSAPPGDTVFAIITRCQ